MAPVRYLAQEEYESTRHGKYSSEKPKPSTLLRLQGPYHPKSNDFTNYPPIDPNGLNDCAVLKIWHHSMSPFGVHKECMAEHHCMSALIPTGEAQFLRAHRLFYQMSPHTHAGAVSIRCCLDKGSRLRVELMEYMIDVEVPVIVNHYSVLTGPTLNGYIVAFLLRGEETCRALIFSFFLNTRGEIQAHVHDYSNTSIPPRFPLKHMWEDPGIIMTRSSWWNVALDGSRDYETVQLITNSWSSTPYEYPEIPPKVHEYNLCMINEKFTRWPLSNISNIKLLDSYQHLQRELLSKFLHPKIYQNVLDTLKVFTTDNPWLGYPYISEPKLPISGGPPVRIQLLLEAYGQFQYFDANGVWSYYNDPSSKEIMDLNLHEKIHCRRGWINSIPWDKQTSQPINKSLSLQLPRTLKDISQRDQHPDVAWGPGAKQARQIKAGVPCLEFPDEFAAPSECSEAANSLRSFVTLADFEDVTSGLRLKRNKRSLEPNPRIPPLSFANRRLSTEKAWEPKRADQTGWNSPKSSQGSRKGSKARNKKFIRNLQATPYPMGEGLLDLTLDEIYNSVINVANPGVCPADEIIEPVKLKAFTSDDGKFDAVSLLAFQQAQLIGQNHNMAKMQREICYLNARLREAGIPRPSHQTNPGHRPVETLPREGFAPVPNPFDTKATTQSRQVSIDNGWCQPKSESEVVWGNAPARSSNQPAANIHDLEEGEDLPSKDKDEAMTSALVEVEELDVSPSIEASKAPSEVL